MFCVGAAVYDRTGDCVAALSGTGLKLNRPTWRVDELGRRRPRRRRPAHAGPRRNPLRRPRPGQTTAGETTVADHRALVITEPGVITLQDVAALVPGPGEVIARPAYVGVCGTDLELLDGVVDPAYVRYPLVPGHEWSGVIEAVGPGVTAPDPGPAGDRRGHHPRPDLRAVRARQHQPVPDLRRDRLHPGRRRRRPAAAARPGRAPARRPGRARRPSASRTRRWPSPPRSPGAGSPGAGRGRGSGSRSSATAPSG